MVRDDFTTTRGAAAIAVVRKVLDGPRPEGRDFDACRAVVRHDPGAPAAFDALCMLLEGALADPSFDIDATQVVVPLLRDLARRRLTPEDLT